MTLTKSQRVRTIQDISSRLEVESWTDIDLILKQFSFPISDQWSGDKKSYVVQMIADANDTDLSELAEHFGMVMSGSAANSNPPPEPSYWEEGKLKVFISHVSTEKEQAAKVRTALIQYGMSAFVAHNDISPTLEWQIEIETALATCELLVALIHPSFIQSQWCDQEIGYALGREIPVFTVRFGADPYGFVSRFQAFNGNGKSEAEIAKEIFEGAVEHKKLQNKMAGVLVDLFIKSGSFANAKARIAHLERLKVWDSTFSERIAKAVKENNQINGSWGVPDQVKALVKKWK